jgi:hypothetical protein
VSLMLLWFLTIPEIVEIMWRIDDVHRILPLCDHFLDCMIFSRSLHIISLVIFSPFV